MCSPDKSPDIHNWKMYEMGPWFETLDARHQREIQFSLLYDRVFGHGTSGHNLHRMIAVLATMLNNFDPPKEVK